MCQACKQPCWAWGAVGRACQQQCLESIVSATCNVMFYCSLFFALCVNTLLQKPRCEVSCLCVRGVREECLPAICECFWGLKPDDAQSIVAYILWVGIFSFE